MKQIVNAILCLLFTTYLQAQSGVVTFESFGCKGEGQDETKQIMQAFDYAKINKLPIKLLGKTYIFSPKNTVDITGVPSITGSGKLDVSNTGKVAGNERMMAVFHVQGEKVFIQNNVRGITQGKQKVQLSPGLNLKKGQTIYITSSEALANSKRSYYCKGQRAIVKSYGKSGELQIEETFFYTIASACIWLQGEQPMLTVTKEVQFVTSPMNFITCFRLYYAKANMSGYYKNFALTAIMYKSSEGTVENMEAELPIIDNNGYSHCIQVADMSDVVIKNCKLSGGRHVISGTAGGLWEKEECGGKGHAGYPSVLVVDGGTYTGNKIVNNINEHIATLDAHGVVEKMTIKNCTIYGGINLGANQVMIDNVTLYTDNKRILNVGSDVDADADWGNYTITNSKFIAQSTSPISLVYGKANVRSLTLENVIVENIGNSAYLLDFRYFAPKELRLFKVKTNAGKRKNLIITNKRDFLDIKNSNFDINSVKIMNNN